MRAKTGKIGSPVKIMRKAIICLGVALIVLGVVSSAGAKSPDEERAGIRKMADKTLKDLYKAQPSSKGAIASAAGYAVFDNMGVHVLLLSTARGSGIAVNQKTKQETFMKMVSGGAGLGAGVKDYRAIFVFENQGAFDRFLNSGWSGSGQADAAAKAGTKGGAYGGAVEVDPGVWVYQLTKNGLALQVTLQGTKYYKNDKLNAAK